MQQIEKIINTKEWLNSYPHQLLYSGLNENGKPPSLLHSTQTRSLILYSIHKIDEENWIPLTRGYKPLGISYEEKHYNYEEFSFLFLKTNDIDFSILYDNGVGFGGYHGFYTYSDLTAPYDYKNFIRYKKIINKAFFRKKEILSYKEAWGYKTK